MTDAGRQTMLALNGIRALFIEIHALMAEATRLLDQAGWVVASPSRKASHLGNAWDAPQDWLPKYLYRWYSSEDAPETLLVLVIHLYEEEDVPLQPWVVLGAYTGIEHLTNPPTVKQAEVSAAGLHIEGEEPTASGRVIRLDLEVGERVSLAVPLMEIDGSETLMRRVIEPLVGAVGEISTGR